MPLKPPPDAVRALSDHSCPTTKTAMVAKFQPPMVKIPFAAKNVAEMSQYVAWRPCIARLQPPIAWLGTKI
jgi:hypothetical protein